MHSKTFKERFYGNIEELTKLYSMVVTINKNPEEVAAYLNEDDRLLKSEDRATGIVILRKVLLKKIETTQDMIKVMVNDPGDKLREHLSINIVKTKLDDSSTKLYELEDVFEKHYNLIGIKDEVKEIINSLEDTLLNGSGFNTIEKKAYSNLNTLVGISDLLDAYSASVLEQIEAGLSVEDIKPYLDKEYDEREEYVSFLDLKFENLEKLVSESMIVENKIEEYLVEFRNSIPKISFGKLSTNKFIKNLNSVTEMYLEGKINDEEYKDKTKSLLQAIGGLEAIVSLAVHNLDIVVNELSRISNGINTLKELLDKAYITFKG